MMKFLPRRIAVLGMCALTVLGSASCAASPAQGGPQPTVSVQTSFPGLAAAAGEPELASIRQARPKPGTVAQAKGPFDDRFRFEHLAFESGTVTGTVGITSDVSDLLELEVLVGFYDKDGRFLGTNRFVHHAGADNHAHPGPPSENEPFKVAAPAGTAGQAASAAAGIPVLVNE